MTDLELEAALRDLGGSLAVAAVADGTSPSAGALDPARRARLRIEAGLSGGPRRRWQPWPAPIALRPVRRGVVLGLVAVVILAAIAGAIGLGVPGVRIVPAPGGSPSELPSGSPTTPATATTGASASPLGTSPSPAIAGPLGSMLDLGESVAVGDAATAVDFPIVLPTASGVEPPVSAWILAGRLSLVWPAGPALPATREPGVGLILSEFRGSVDPGYFQKTIGPGTTVTTVQVDGVTGYWISGAPHVIVFVDQYGYPVYDSRRIVGDTLLWARGDVTYRLESGLGREAAIALAGSLR
jgi:hypothetical protein